MRESHDVVGVKKYLLKHILFSLFPAILVGKIFKSVIDICESSNASFRTRVYWGATVLEFLERNQTQSTSFQSQR